MTENRASVPSRRAYLDWLRGVAVLLMVLWHSVDSWHESVNRGTAAFHVIGFLAGWAAPMFLFLAGVSLPLGGEARMARGADRRTASGALMRRGWQVFLLAHLFRLQSFLLNVNASWSSVLKPDILNILGLGMVMAGFAWGRATSTRSRVWWLLGPAVLVVCVLTPWIPSWWWPSLLPPRMEGYIRVVGGNAVFSLFPAVAYVFVGAFVGSLLAERTNCSEARFHAVSSAVGLFMIAVAYVPLPASAASWAGVSMITAFRIGVILLLLAAAWAWLRISRPSPANALMVFGQTSLFVYWVHVELAYGWLSYPLHKALPLSWALTAYALLMLALYGAARLWLRWRPGRPLVPIHMVAQPVARRI